MAKRTRTRRKVTRIPLHVLVGLLTGRIDSLNATVDSLTHRVLDVMGGKTGGCPRCLRMSEEVRRQQETVDRMMSQIEVLAMNNARLKANVRPPRRVPRRTRKDPVPTPRYDAP